MTYVKLALALVMFSMCTACTTSRFEGSPATKPGTQISGSSVVIYSFLDVRNDFFGKTMLQQLHKQLVDKLGQRGVATRLVMYTPTTADTASIQLKDFLKTQRADEASHADRYRLLIVPWFTTAHEASLDSRVDWTLTDTKTELPVWFASQSIYRTVMFSRDEAPETRASEVIDSVISKMAAGGLFAGQQVAK